MYHPASSYEKPKLLGVYERLATDSIKLPENTLISKIAFFQVFTVHSSGTLLRTKPILVFKLQNRMKKKPNLNL